MADQYTWDKAKTAGYDVDVQRLTRYSIADGNALQTNLQALSGKDKYLNDNANSMNSSAHDVYNTVYENSAKNWANSAISGFSAIDVSSKIDNAQFTIPGSPYSQGIAYFTANNGLNISQLSDCCFAIDLDPEYKSSYFTVSTAQPETYRQFDSSTPYNDYRDVSHCITLGQAASAKEYGISMTNSFAHSHSISLINSTTVAESENMQGGCVACVDSTATVGSLCMVKSLTTERGSMAFVNSKASSKGTFAAVCSTAQNQNTIRLCCSYDQPGFTYTRSIALANCVNIGSNAFALNKCSYVGSHTFAANNCNYIDMYYTDVSLNTNGFSIALNNCSYVKHQTVALNNVYSMDDALAANNVNNGSCGVVLNNCSGFNRAVLMNNCHNMYGSIALNNCSGLNTSIAVNECTDLSQVIALNNCRHIGGYSLVLNQCGLTDEFKQAHPEYDNNGGTNATIAVNYCHAIGYDSFVFNGVHDVGWDTIAVGNVYNSDACGLYVGTDIHNVGNDMSFGHAYSAGWDRCFIANNNGPIELSSYFRLNTSYYGNTNGGVCIQNCRTLASSFCVLDSVASAKSVAINGSVAYNTGFAINNSSAYNGQVAFNSNTFTAKNNQINGVTMIVKRFNVNTVYNDVDSSRTNFIIVE